MDRWREQWAFYRWNEARIKRTCFTRRQPRFVVVMLGRALWEPPSYVRFVQIPQPNGNVQFSSSQFRLDVYAYDLEIFTKCMLGNCINSDLLRFMCRVTVCRTLRWRGGKRSLKVLNFRDFSFPASILVNGVCAQVMMGKYTKALYVIPEYFQSTPYN